MNRSLVFVSVFLVLLWAALAGLFLQARQTQAAVQPAVLDVPFFS